jgi:hypothetical protein
MERVREPDDCVLILGLGDLGQQTVDLLSHRPGGRMVTAARDSEVARAAAGQARLIAAMCDGPRHIEPAQIDLDDVGATAVQLARLHPDVIVLTASRVTWWQLPDAAEAVPFGAWLPLQVILARNLMQARAAAGLTAPVVCLPYPDAVGPVLAGAGLAPELGAGNVLEMAAKLTTLAAHDSNVRPDEVDVRLVAHHATERTAFNAFDVLAGSSPRTPPPFLARICVRGEPLADEIAHTYFTTPYPILGGRATHRITAAAVVATIQALRSDVPQPLHAPSPGGRPGGYPVSVSRAGVELNLPTGVTEADAIAVNAVAARWDGIEQITPDGTVTFTPVASDEIHRTLGIRLTHIELDQHAAIADELAAWLRRPPPADGGDAR